MAEDFRAGRSLLLRAAPPEDGFDEGRADDLAPGRGAAFEAGRDAGRAPGLGEGREAADLLGDLRFTAISAGLRCDGGATGP